jgi:hypothetical protein
MILTTKISCDSQVEDTVITLDKFFQFIIIDKINANRCKVSIYNAISFSNNGDNSKLVIDFHNQHHTQIANVKFTDYKRFYEETDVLKQFWGKDSKFSADISDTITKFSQDLSTEDIEEIVKALEACDSNGIFGVSENKDSINNVIINPSPAHFIGAQAKLKCNFSQIKSNSEMISNGYWFKAEFETDLSTGPSGFNIESKLEFSKKSHFKSPDFKIYIQTGKKYDLRSGKVTVISDGTDYIGEVVKVFSQSKIKYFSEWAEHGIYSSSLFKASPGTTAEKAINDVGLESISVSAALEDLELPKRREISLLIFSIIFSLFASFGFDKTRQGESGFKEIFPSYDYLSIDGSWLLVCIGILIFYYLLQNNKWSWITKFFAIFPIFLWFFSYLILNGSTWGSKILSSDIGIMLSHLLYHSNIIIVGVLFIGYVFMRLLKKIGSVNSLNIKLKKVIQVWKGEL